MQRLDHLFHLVDPRDRIVRISCVGSFGHVIVFGVVTPIIGQLRVAFIHAEGTVIRERQKLDMGYSEAGDVIQPS
ncbi:hypothetical protein D3C75_1290670 [compost metagenome]